MRLAAFAVLLIPFSASAQDATASLTGIVVDIIEARIPRASVELQTGTTKLQVQTDDYGRYQFSNLPAGNYTLTVTMLGFRRFTLRSIELSEGEQKRISPITLDVGAIADCGHYPPAFRLLAGDGSFGGLAGSVTGAANVEVTLVCRTFAACRSTKTDSIGLFSFGMLSPGDYGLTFRREGFYPEGAIGYFYRVKAGLESIYGPVTMERCPNGNCDPKQRPQRLVHCE